MFRSRRVFALPALFALAVVAAASWATASRAAEPPPDGDVRGAQSVHAVASHRPLLGEEILLEQDRHRVYRLGGVNKSVALPARMQWISQSWNGENAQIPYLAYMPEKDRVLLLVGCRQPLRSALLASNDGGKTWGPRRWLVPEGAKEPVGGALGLAYLGRGKLLAFPEDLKTFWHSDDYGDTWKTFTPRQSGEYYSWDPPLVLQGSQGGQGGQGGARRLVQGCWRPTGVPWGSDAAPYSQAYLRSSADEGRTWSEAVKIPQWLGVNEVNLLATAAGDWLAACRTDYPKRFARFQLDHYGGLAMSVSKDQGRTWTALAPVYEWGRHHPSLVRLPDRRILMSYIVRLGYPDAPGGMPRFGVEAVVGDDRGVTWDLDHRYVLAAWLGNIPSAKAEAWFCSGQSTSTVRLSDGTLLTAFGAGMRNPRGATSCKMDVALVRWRLD